MISRDHPFHFLSQFYEKNFTFTFSKYIYTPDSLLDDRECFLIKGNELTEDRINYEINSLNTDQELAVHSKVKYKNHNYHIPMIDFSITPPITENIFSRINYFIPKKIILDTQAFSSGRSLHAYSSHIIRPGEWYEFMGRLLLINLKNEPDIIDNRWIGHRLMSGYSSLRWSNNSGNYLSMPKKTLFPDLQTNS